jgi:hypothetical protein
MQANKKGLLLLVIIIFFGYSFFISIHNQTKYPIKDAYEIAKNEVPQTGGFKIGQISGGTRWSFDFSRNPIYKVELYTVKYDPIFQKEKFIFYIDAKTKEVLKMQKHSSH